MSDLVGNPDYWVSCEGSNCVIFVYHVHIFTGVGKSSLLLRFSDNTFSGKEKILNPQVFM